jgi:hypothetical protein
MDIIKLKNLLKENKYILIDYSEKFKIDIDFDKMKNNKRYEQGIYLQTCNIYVAMDEKLKQAKYDSVVFLLDMSKIVKYNRVLFQILVKGGEIPFEKDILYLKNSDNYMWFKKGEEIKNNIIINFVNQKNNKYECNVCFEEYGLWVNGSINNGSYCGICDFRTCYKCCIQAKEKGLDNNKCFGCRTQHKSGYTMLR